MNQQIIYPKLSYIITGLCFKVHTELSRFCRERQYADRLEEFLRDDHLNYQREIEIVKLHPKSPKGNRTDFIIDGKIVLDVKAKKFITKDDYFQMQRYLKSADLKLGLIVNFRNTFLKPKRVINLDYDSFHSYVNS